jgi:hypothetical protein
VSKENGFLVSIFLGEKIQAGPMPTRGQVRRRCARARGLGHVH